ncbi:MAG: hypothetical protein E7460_03655 [Ruminococcaceae bacterium]|nr:hypothetical protein [Oscillospiraceae bacterium]
MSDQDRIARDIQRLFKTAPFVHVNVKMTAPRVELKNSPARIAAVYPHVFILEETTTGRLRRHSAQYTDVLTGKITLTELTKTE